MARNNNDNRKSQGKAGEKVASDNHDKEFYQEISEKGENPRNNNN
ncbi:hypothetical protein [Peribacillus sp. NPDC097295]